MKMQPALERARGASGAAEGVASNVSQAAPN